MNYEHWIVYQMKEEKRIFPFMHVHLIKKIYDYDSKKITLNSGFVYSGTHCIIILLTGMRNITEFEDERLIYFPFLMITYADKTTNIK